MGKRTRKIAASSSKRPPEDEPTKFQPTAHNSKRRRYAEPPPPSLPPHAQRIELLDLNIRLQRADHLLSREMRAKLLGLNHPDGSEEEDSDLDCPRKKFDPGFQGRENVNSKHVQISEETFTSEKEEDMEDEEVENSIDTSFAASFGRPHPLLIPNVLNQIFEKLSFADLKSCRTACKDWDSEVITLLRGKTSVTITNYKRLKDYAENFQTRKKFCDQFIFGKGLNIGAPTMLKFFQDYGSQIKTASFQMTKWKEPDLTDVLFTKLVNLEDLTMECLVPKWNENNHYLEYVRPEDLDEERPPQAKLQNLRKININIKALDASYSINHPNSPVKTFLLDLFRVSPNLERIGCPRSETNYQPLEFLFPLDPVHVNHFINGEVLDALDELNGMGFESNMRKVLFDTLVHVDGTNSTRLEKLSTIDINLTLREEHVRKLHSKRFPLACIDIIITQNVTLPTLHSFLSSIGGTLKILVLRYLKRSTCTMEFPSSSDLKCLQSLTLNGFKGSLQFLHSFLSLTRFVLIKPPKLCIVFPVAEFDFGERSPLQKMHTVEVYEVEKSSLIANFRPQLMQKFARNFPNMKRLGLENVTDATLRAIYTNLPGLEELVLKNGNFTDAGIVGVSQKICDDIRARGKLGEEEYILQRDNPFVGSLRRLKKLELTSKHMTDVGVILGIIYCPALTHLSIMAYGVTDRSLRKIADEMYNLEYLKTEYCSQITMSGVEYIESKMKGKQISINEYEGAMSSTEMWKFLKRNNGLALSLHKLPS